MKNVIAVAMMLVASAVFGQVDPQCQTCPTKTPTPKATRTPTKCVTETPTPRPTPTATYTPTTVKTPTPTPTPTEPGPTPTPPPKCEDMGGSCGAFYGCTGNSAYMGRASDCDFCCKPVTPTPTPTPLECGQACVPSFLEVGTHFMLPEITVCGGEQTNQPVYRVERILPSGWILVREDQGREIWVQWTLLKQMVPVWVVAVQ